MEPVTRNPAEIEPKENVFLGVVGALLFSLAGALVYFLLSRVGYIASLSASVGALCACFGYGLFSRKKGTKAGVIAAAVTTVITMALAVVFCLAFDFYEYIQNDYANVKLTEVIGRTVRCLFDGTHQLDYGAHVYWFDMSGFVKDLIGTAIFTALGIFGFVGTERNKRKAAAQAAQPQTVQPQTPPTENDSPEEE